MILIDGVYINDGGGMVLLKYLVEILEKTNLHVFYLFDDRTSEVFCNVGVKREFISNSLRKRKQFYENHGDKFETVLCFGNVPPPIKLKAKVFVYFHQPLFLKIPKSFSFKNKIIYNAKQFVLNYYKNNASIWLTQSTLIQQELANRYFFGNISSIKILPFYPPLNFDTVGVKRNKNTFLYVSNAAPHKNHQNLINAFCKAYDQLRQGSLVVTVPNSAETLCQIINDKKKEGYPIQNVGFVDRDVLKELYLSHEYLIFPSLAESFGLGLAEAIDGGCKVIASDLAYTYQVCNPSLTFNPHVISEIEGAIIKAVTEELPLSEKLITNDVSQLISLFSE